MYIVTEIKGPGKKTVIELQSGIVVIEGYLIFELVVSCKTPISLSACHITVIAIMDL
jgi:hypothetical protein